MLPRSESCVGSMGQQHVDTVDGDFGALEGLLAPSGLLGPQTQKAFLYMCYRQQFLEYIDNREC